MFKNQKTWISASSSSSFLSCPKSYWYNTLFRDKDGDKVSTVSKYLTMGIASHNPLEMLARFPSEERPYVKLYPEFNRTWKENKGVKGGFPNDEVEEECKQKTIGFIKRAQANIHHLLGETVFLTPEGSLPQMVLSKEHQITLCGKVDYIIKEGNSYKVLDYKTGQKPEKEGSLQLPIYKILLDKYFSSGENVRAYYWYLAFQDDPVEKSLPSLEECKQRVLDVALRMKEAREKNEFICPREDDGGCFACRDMRRIERNDNVIFVGKNSFGSKQYFVP